jgi:integral membrane protein
MMVYWFRILGFLEAFSFLGLLLIAMPLKYIWGMPLAVKILGSIHGGLFVAYVLAAIYIADKLKWPLKTLFYSWVAAVLPLGTIIFDKKFLSHK